MVGHGAEDIGERRRGGSRVEAGALTPALSHRGWEREQEGDDFVAGVVAAAGADLGEGLVEEGFEGGAGGADAGGEVGVFEGVELGGENGQHES